MMKLLHQKIFRILFIIFLSLSPQLWGQVEMTTTGSYNQNFDTLPTSGNIFWAQNSTIPNWYAALLDGTEDFAPQIRFGAATTNSATGGIYSYGTNTDRALGSQGSNSADAIAYGVLLRNTSGSTITNITVSYTMEQWRNGGNTSAQPLSFYYKKSTSIINQAGITDNTGWTAVAGLTLTTPIFTSSASGLNGNLTANKKTVENIALTGGLSLADGEYIMLKWYDINDPSNDHGLSVDDLTINWTVPVANSAPTVTVTSPQTFTYGTAGSFTFTVGGSPAPTTAQITAVETGQSALPAGITLNATTKTINVASTVPAGTYNLTISATNSEGTGTKDVVVVVNKANQSITFNNISKAYGDADFTLSATGGVTGVTETYSSANTAVATIAGNTATITGVGTSTITVTNPGNANYNAGTANATLTVNKANQTITFSNINKTYGDSNFTLSATGGNSGEAISYVSGNNNIATISGNTVTITGTGILNITASQAGNANYNAAANVTRTLTVSPKAVTITGAAALDKVYDGNTSATLSASAAITTSDIVGSDDVSLGTYTAAFDTASVNTGKTVTATYALTGAQAARYTLTQPTGLTAAITAKELTISGIQVSNKVEDGNTSATITGTAVLNGIISPDVVTLDSSAATASFADAAVGTNKPVTVSGYAIGGTSAANYTLQQPQNLTASITDVTLQNQTITFNPLTNVTYGGADFNLTATASSNLTVTYTSSNTSVATVNGSTVTIVGVGTTTITAQQVGDSSYNPAPPVTQDLIVGQKALTVINTTVSPKVYDKTTTTQVSGTLSGVVGTDVVALTSGTAAFATDDAGSNIAITTQFSISGTDAGNYTITQPIISGTITPAALTLTNPSASNKAYDGTVNAVVAGTLNGILSGDTVTLTGTGTFASPSKGTGIAVTSTATLGGADAANYTLTQPTGLTANITGLTITVTASASNKEYNKTTDAAITVTQTNGVVTGDDVTVIGGGTFNNANAGTNKPVTANLTLTGTAAGNYTLTQPTGLSAAITPKAVTIDTSNTIVSDKTYNGNTSAQLNNTTIVGLIAGDETNVSASTGTFAQATPGTGITVNNITLTGTAASNYSLTQPTALLGNIIPAVLAFNGVAALGKVYDGTDAATIVGNLTGKVGADVVTYVGTGTFASVDVGTAIPVTANITLTGANASNYTITQPTGLSNNITKKNITVVGIPQNKVYDRTTTANVTDAAIAAGNIITGDDVTLTSSTFAGTFANYNAGNGINVTSLFTLQGADAGNYNVVSQTIGTANITPLTITADISNAVVTKQYSNTDTAVLTGVNLSGYIAADVPGLQAVQGTYASVTPGTNIPVTVELTGANAGNYVLTQPGLTGTITKRVLTVTAANKTKLQGDTNPTLIFTVSNFATGESAANALGYAAPTISTTAVTSSPAGAYPITVTGGSADYYEFNLVNGWMMVNPPANTVFNPGTLWSNDISGTNPNADNPFISGQTIPASSYITVSGVGRGSGITGVSANNRYTASAWGTAYDANKYFYFTITPVSGYKINFTNFVYTGQVSSNNPPTQFAVKSSVDNYTATIGTASAGGEIITLTSAAYQNVSAPITFRLYAWGGTNTGATFSVNDFSFSGSVAQVPATSIPTITSVLTDNSVIGTTDTYQITATGTPALTLSAANLPVGASINASGLISFDGTTPAGQYTIALTAASYYGTDTKNLVYAVTKKDQALTFNPDQIPTKFLNEAPFVVTATNTAPLAVSYTSSDTSVATIAQDGTITITGVGTTTITASNAGDATYNAVSLLRNFTVLPTPVITAAPASIAFTAVQGQGPSAAAQLTSFIGTNLSPASGNLTLTASSGFEVAMGIGTFGSTADFAYTAGTVNQANPQIFVRLAAGQAQGTYNGTLTISGGNATYTVTLTGTVEPAPAITTTATAFGPYCFGTENSISVPYTTQGTFPQGSYYVQLSDNAGVFPNDFSNTISAAATASPITATLPATLTAGNYRVRVIHLSTGLTLTSSINNNGSNITINVTPAPSATALTFCNSATVANLTATGTALKWYATANSTTALTATDAVTTGTYFVTQTLNGCESPKTQVAVTVNVTPAPTATALTFCNSATVANLTATGTALKWYATANSTTALAATDAVATGTYYVTQTLNGCESPKAQVAVTVNVTPAPTATALTFCNSATVANLTATGTALKWYATANSTTALTATDAVTTGTYFVTQTLNGCESPKTQVAVTVNVTPAPTATALTFCNSATVANLTATGTALKWYATTNNTTPLAATDAVTTGTYYVTQTLNGCESPKAQVAVTVNVTPAPSATALIFCTSATVANLTATGTALKWYATANSTTALAATDAVITGTYYVTQTLNGCESPKTQVAVTVNVTPAPSATALILNQGATVANLTANGTDLKWYAAANGGNELTADTILESGSYFVSQTINGCESTRTEVVVTIITIVVPDAPTASAQTFCNSATVEELVAQGENLKWYASQDAEIALALTDALATGSYYVSQTINEVESVRTEASVTINVTPAPIATALTFNEGATVADLTANGTGLKWYTDADGGNELTSDTVLESGSYFVSQTINGCESTRTEVVVTITTIVVPEAPIASAQVFCNSATVEELVALGENLKWYATQNAETALALTDALATGNYYVSQTVNDVESARTEVAITINVTPAPEGEATQLFAEEGTIANIEAEGQNIKWYASEADAIAGENELTTETSLVSGSTYYATQTVNGCESNQVLAVTVTITLDMDDVSKFTYKYYPNPVADKLYIESVETIINITVYSLTGQEVINQQWNTQGGTLDVSSLESATYLVKINFGTAEKTIRMVKNKK